MANCAYPFAEGWVHKYHSGPTVVRLSRSNKVLKIYSFKSALKDAYLVMF